MKSLASKMFVAFCLLAAMMTWGAVQGQEGKRKKNDASAGIKKKLEAAALPADVLEKCNKIVAEHAAKINEATAKVNAILTPEQRAAQKAAKKAAKDAGKKGRQAAAEVEAAMKLTAEQKTKLDAANKELTALTDARNDALRAVLSVEQQETVLGKARRKKA
jgi:hypothetical protein